MKLLKPDGDPSLRPLPAATRRYGRVGPAVWHLYGWKVQRKEWKFGGCKVEYEENEGEGSKENGEGSSEWEGQYGESGEWRVESGEWRVESGEWRVECEE